jgi:capsule polysaccharide export protein KpsE/RkpR
VREAPIEKKGFSKKAKKNMKIFVAQLHFCLTLIIVVVYSLLFRSGRYNEASKVKLLVVSRVSFAGSSGV